MAAPPSDQQLVDGSLRGEQAACELLYARFAPRLMAACLRYARTRAEAEDLLQESFIRIFRYLPQYRADGPLEAWLRRIAVRTAINHYHAATRQLREVELSEAADVTTEDNNVLARLSAQEIRGLINQLPDGYRLVLNLYCIEGYSHKEIGELLGIDERTSSSQLHKARRRLLALVRRPEYALGYDSF